MTASATRGVLILLLKCICLQNWNQLVDTATALNTGTSKPNIFLQSPTAADTRVLGCDLRQLEQEKHRTKRSVVDFNKTAKEQLPDNVFVALSIDLFHRCADSHFCSASPNRNLSRANTSLSCCVNCSCEDACELTGTCCSDIQTTDDRKYDFYNENPDTDCRHVSFSTTGDPYRFVTSCPSPENSQLTQRCRTPGTAAIDRLPVFDTQGLLNYQNRYCAACHGVTSESLVLWRETLRCSGGKQSNDSTGSINTDELSRRDCEGAIVPPEVDGIQHTVCYKDIIGTCNITGRWAERDDVVQAGCNGLQMYYLYYDRRLREHFKNIYCAICNGFETHVGVTECPKKIPGQQSGVALGFQFLLSHVTGELEHHQICDGGQEWDPLMGRCRDYHCSYPTMADDLHTACNDIYLISQAFHSIPARVEFEHVVWVSHYTTIRSAIWTFLTKIKPSGLFLKNIALHFETHIPIAHVGLRLDKDYLDSVNITVRHVTVNIVSYEMLMKSEIRMSNSYHKLKDALFNTHFNNTGMIESIESADGLSKFRFRRIQTDAWNLFPADSKYSIQLPKGDNYHAAYIYENVYTGQAVFGVVPKDDVPYFSSETPYAYRTNFLQCPGFEYRLKDVGMKRATKGLEVENTGVKFGFGEFVSVNISHVRVCVESVQKKIMVTSGSSVCRVLWLLVWLGFGFQMVWVVFDFTCFKQARHGRSRGPGFEPGLGRTAFSECP